jgi:hypothetical protein
VQATCLEWPVLTGATIRTEFDTVVIQSILPWMPRPHLRVSIRATPSTTRRARREMHTLDRTSAGLLAGGSKAPQPGSSSVPTQAASAKSAWSNCGRRAKIARNSTARTPSPLRGIVIFYLLVDEPEVYGLPCDPKMPRGIGATRSPGRRGGDAAIGALPLGRPDRRAV